jgi:hypothetical protein
MKRTRNYNFKWWHGMLGLVGLSMVLGAARGARAASQPAEPMDEAHYDYRGTNIVVEPSLEQPGYVASIFSMSGTRLQWSVLGTLESAKRWAERWVDQYIDSLGGTP